MSTDKKNIRFTAGKMLMFSQKTKFKPVPYFSTIKGKPDGLRNHYINGILSAFHNGVSAYHAEKYKGNFSNKDIFLLINFPELIKKTDERYFKFYYNKSRSEHGGLIWRMELLYKTNKVVMYLTKKDYSQKLIIASPRRIAKYNIG